MTTKNTLNVYNTQKTFLIVSSITELAREMIEKRPGIYKGNLECWLLKNIPKSAKIDIELAFLQLLKEGYFFSYEDTIYPPNKVDVKVKILTKFVYNQKLSFLDYGILYELCTNGFNRLSEFSREIVSQGWDENEREVKIRIQELFWENIIIEDHGILKVNWELIQEAVE